MDACFLERLFLVLSVIRSREFTSRRGREIRHAWGFNTRQGERWGLNVRLLSASLAAQDLPLFCKLSRDFSNVDSNHIQ